MAATVPIYLLTRDQLIALSLTEADIDKLPSLNVDQTWLQNVAKAITSSPALTNNRSAIKMKPNKVKKTNLPRGTREEPEESGAKMNDLPERPFELIFGYLSLKDLIKYRDVSRRWRKMIDSFRVKNLYYSDNPNLQIEGKIRMASSALVLNFISSTSFVSFFNAFGHSIISNLKHLRLHEFGLDEENRAALFAQALNSFGELEQLDIIRLNYSKSDPNIKLELNLPMLKSIQLIGLHGIEKLTLDAPVLKRVRLLSCTLFLHLIHESVERLFIDFIAAVRKGVKNVKHLYIDDFKLTSVRSTLLSGLEQLESIHLFNPDNVLALFKQKQQYNRIDLKIFYCGMRLNGPDDPAIHLLSNYFDKKTFGLFAEDLSRLADEIPFQWYLHYETFKCAFPPESEITILKRFFYLNEIIVWQPVLDIERFLNILKNCDNLIDLQFKCDQPQKLFDRLPESCAAIRSLEIFSRPSDDRFLFKLQSLVSLCIFQPIDIKFIREVLKELKFLSEFSLEYLHRAVIIQVVGNPKRFKLFVGWVTNQTEVPNLDSAIQFIVEKAGKEEEYQDEEEEDEECESEEYESEEYESEEYESDEYEGEEYKEEEDADYETEEEEDDKE